MKPGLLTCSWASSFLKVLTHTYNPRTAPKHHVRAQLPLQAPPSLRCRAGGHVELLATQVWVLVRSARVLAASEPLRSCLFAREFGEAGWGRARVPARTAGQRRPALTRSAVRAAGSGARWGTPCLESAEAPWRRRGSPAPPAARCSAREPPRLSSESGRVAAPGPRWRPWEQRWSNPITLKMKVWGWLALFLGALLGTAWARRSQDLHCGACRALVDELEWEIAQVDHRKTIQMGSFRINPDGSQSVMEVPYARSEAHLTELLEEVCDRMKEYGEQIDPSTHRKNYVRVVGRNGESSELDLQGIRIDSDISGTLKFACESIVEEYEDELIEFFSREAHNVKDRLCSMRTDLCDHTLPLSHDEL
ncbi:protein canopy homolog 2 [Dasypus novemcinctus]|uniref:protein canopy homolog 2 n=1 Tax=Dasypus novemcinctus TaxID=9361 RepID=UPI000329101C|nr:protein canopy homolog 2 [Dasypus novemcinctus]